MSQEKLLDLMFGSFKSVRFHSSRLLQ